MKKTTLKNLKGVFIALFLACLVGLCSLAFASKPQQASAATGGALPSVTVSDAKVGIEIEEYYNGPKIQTSLALTDTNINNIIEIDALYQSVNWRVCLFVFSDTSFYEVLSQRESGYGSNIYEDANNYAVVYKTYWNNLNRYDETFGFVSAINLDTTNSNKTLLYFWTYEYTTDSSLSSLVNLTAIYEYNPYNDLVDSLVNPTIDESNYQKYATETQKALGIYHEEDSAITLNYLKMNDFSRYSSENVSETFAVDSYMLQNSERVIAQVQKLKGWTGASDFNAVCREYCYDTYGTAFYQREKIIRQALRFDYSYDSATNTGTIDVVYSDYLYKDVALRVSNNDPENNLSLDVYTTNVKENGNGTLTLTFDFNNVCTGIYNLCGWQAGHFDENDLFTPGFLKSDFTFSKPNENDVAINVTDSELTLTFRKDNQNALFGVALDAVICLVEDVDLAFTYEYIELDSNLSETVKKSTSVIKKYSELLAMSDMGFYSDYGAVINGAISPSVLNGQNYMKYAGIKKVYDKTNGAYNFVVQYNVNSAVRVRNNVNNDIAYIVLDKNSLDYVISDYVSQAFIPAGLRIKEIISSDKDVKVYFNDKKPLESTFHVDFKTSDKRVVELTAQLTDKWVVKVEYFEQYKDTPFLLKTIYSTEIRVSDYNDIYNLTAEELKAIMKKDSFDLMGLATIENIIVKNVGDDYNVTIDYTPAYLKKIDKDNCADEVEVEITKYTKWTQTFGKSWSIMMLNTEKNKWFNYSNDVNIDDVYGFFSVVVFNEKISDLSLIFKNYSYDGCVVEFTKSEAAGSDFYKFISGIPGPSAKTGMFLCEIFDDQNKIYNSHFFYLDGTTDMPFASNTGATSYDDTGSSVQNFFEQMIAGLTNLWQQIDEYVYLVLIIVVAVLGIVGSVKLLSLFWRGSMTLTWKIILTIIFVAIWACAIIFGGPWVISALGIA